MYLRADVLCGVVGVVGGVVGVVGGGSSEIVVCVDIRLCICTDMLQCPSQHKCAPVSKLSNFDIDVDEKRAQQAAACAHEAENGNLPHIVKHACAVLRQAVGIEPKITVAAKP